MSTLWLTLSVLAVIVNEATSEANPTRSTAAAFASFCLGLAALIPGLGFIFVLPTFLVAIIALLQIRRSGAKGRLWAYAGLALACFGVIFTAILASSGRTE